MKLNEPKVSSVGLTLSLLPNGPQFYSPRE